MSRRRGAQPNNTNALKHGFYSNYLKPAEHTDLDLVEFGDIASEIAMLRAYTRRLLDFEQKSELGIDQFMTLLNLLGESALRISTIIYRYRMLNGDQDSHLAETLSSALDIVNKDLPR